MKKYKLVNGSGYSKYVEGEIYDEEGIKGCFSPKYLVEEFPNDWEEVVEVKLYKFIGDKENLGGDGSYRGLVVGNIYNLTDKCPFFFSDYEEYNFVKYYVQTYPNDWEEVLVSSSSNVYQVLTFTDAEIVTLITFLNDNFEDFEQFIEGVGEGKLDWSWWGLLDSIDSDNRPQLLIDKIEKNEGLSLAERVTLITFLNDNFEKFTDFVNNDLFNQDGLMLVYWARLDGSVLDASSLLIDKIERA